MIGRGGGILAHGFGIRYDLPVPLGLYLGGAGTAVALTFAVLALAVRRSGAGVSYPRLRLTAAPPLRALLLGPLPRVAGGTVGVAVLAAVVVTGLWGAGDATSNPAEYLVWIYFWAGTVVASGLVGNIFALVNPWAAIHDSVSWLRRRLGPPRDAPRPLLAYPARLGLWPAAAGYLAFAWLELASGWGPKPHILAIAALAYTVYTLLMMSLTGRDVWLSRGEPFSVLFHFVGAFAPVEVRTEDPQACRRCTSRCPAGQRECVGCGECFRRGRTREVNLRPWAVGLLRLPPAGWDTVVVVILTLSSLAFDGISATPPWNQLSERATPLTDSLGAAGPVLLRTLGLLAVTALFLAVFAAVVRLTEAVTGMASDGVRLTSLFAYTLIPIALVYNAAHNYSYMVIQGQGLIPLLADPLHRGAHLLPTGGYSVSFALADAALVWWIQIILIVVGHMLAVYLAHVRALTAAPAARAVRGQLPMMSLMVAYTMASLWILAQPITESG